MTELLTVRSNAHFQFCVGDEARCVLYPDMVASVFYNLLAKTGRTKLKVPHCPIEQLLRVFKSAVK